MKKILVLLTSREIKNENNNSLPASLTQDPPHPHARHYISRNPTLLSPNDHNNPPPPHSKTYSTSKEQQ